SDYYIPAQFFLGVAYTREFKGEPAVDAFKNVLRRSLELQESEGRKQKKKDRQAKRTRKKTSRRRALTSVELTFADEMRQYEHLAALGLANIFYMVGKFDMSVKYLDRINIDSKYFLDA